MPSNVHVAPILPGGPTPVSEVRAVTNENQLVEGAALSHDGKWLVYDSNRGGRQQLYKIRVDGGEPIQLTNDSTDHFAARWSRDDRQIVAALMTAARDLAHDSMRKRRDVEPEVVERRGPVGRGSLRVRSA